MLLTVILIVIARPRGNLNCNGLHQACTRQSPTGRLYDLYWSNKDAKQDPLDLKTATVILWYNLISVLMFLYF